MRKVIISISAAALAAMTLAGGIALATDAPSEPTAPTAVTSTVRHGGDGPDDHGGLEHRARTDDDHARPDDDRDDHARPDDDRHGRHDDHGRRGTDDDNGTRGDHDHS